MEMGSGLILRQSAGNVSICGAPGSANKNETRPHFRSAPATGRAPVEEFIPIGPLRVRVRIPEGTAVTGVKLLVSDQKPSLTIDKGTALFQLPSLVDHEVVVLE